MNIILRIIFTVLVFTSIGLSAQQENQALTDSLSLQKVDSIAIQINDSIVSRVDTLANLKTIVNDIDDDVDSSFINNIDELHKKWYFSCIDSVDYLDAEMISKIRKDRINFPDSVIISQMDSLQYNSAVQLSYNKIVKSYINLYTQRRREQVCNMLGLAEYYFPIFEEELDKQGLPLELKYLPVIESALNPLAFSRAGACGLWQFMYGTGKDYKLKIDSYIDERRDPVKSTQAAVRYLKDLYKVYGDWMLVIAAYNCGPGNVNKAIRRTGGKRNYWDIYFRLPRETRGYVPTFIAAMYVFNYSDAYNLSPIRPDFPPMCDTIMVNSKVHFEQIAKVVNMPIPQLRELNPQYRRNIVPARPSRPLAIKMPYNFVGDFVEMQDSVLAYNRSKYFDNKDRIVDPRARYNNYAHAAPKNRTKIYYKVRKGDVVGKIAQKFRVRNSDLRYWNNIKRNRIRIGQKLVLYIPNSRAKKYTNKKGIKVAPATEQLAKGDFIYYKVRRGENLWTIARKYPGVSNNDIIRWNNIRNAKLVKPGTKLKIKIL